jgi:hypothetical protein
MSHKLRNDENLVVAQLADYLELHPHLIPKKQLVQHGAHAQ